MIDSIEITLIFLKVKVSPYHFTSRSKALTIAFLVAVLCMPLQALSWGSEGHQVIAKLAESQLTPKARDEVGRLLAAEPDATMASASTWADEHRNPATAPWHYVNFPRGVCTYVGERDCPDGKCVVAAINKQVEILGSSAPDDKKLLALKYVIHFVGDVHQPLHAGYGDDRGGNSYQLQAFMRGSNLHAVWDTGLIRYLNQDAEALTARLERQVYQAPRLMLSRPQRSPVESLLGPASTLAAWWMLRTLRSTRP